MTTTLSNHRLPLVAAFLMTALALALAPAARADAVCEAIDSPCTLADISAQALVDSGADAVIKAGIVSATGADGSEVSLYKVHVRFADGTEATLYYDAATCTALLPPVPTVGFLDAMAAAMAKSAEVAPGLGEPIVLSGKLVNELLAPAYVFLLIDPQDSLMRVRVDALTGEATVVDAKAAKKKKKKGKKGVKHCFKKKKGDDSDSDSDGDSDADSDKDSDADSDSDVQSVE